MEDTMDFKNFIDRANVIKKAVNKLLIKVLRR